MRSYLAGRPTSLIFIAALCIVTRLITGCGGNPVTITSPSPATTTLAALVNSGTLQSGAPATFILPAGAGKPIASAVTIQMTPSSGGSSFTLTVSSVTDAANGGYSLSTTLPALPITAVTSFSFVASGTATSSFTTTPLTTSVLPGTALLSVQPALAPAGTTIDVTLTGIATNWTSATTTASFGAGISVGGATTGIAGPVTANSSTTATAHLVLAPTAAAGTRTVTVTTGSQVLSLQAAFTVTPAAPVANAAGPYSGTTGNAVRFSAQDSSDPGGLALTYTWNFGDGAAGAGITASHTYTNAGTYPVVLTVTNSAGLSTTASTTATITSPPQPPVASAGGPYSGTAGSAITFDASGSADPKGEALTYAWSFGDGTSGSGATPTHTYAASGTYTVTLTVTNTDKLSASITTSAVVVASAQAPTANAGGPYTGTAGVSVTFSGAASTDPKNEVLTYAWDFGDSTTGFGVSPTHTYGTNGVFSVALTVTNTDKLSGKTITSATIAAAPQAPTVNAGGPYSGVAGTAVRFTASATDPKNEALNYSWNFGDGGTASGAATSHIFASAGTFHVTVIATNTDGLSTAAEALATITAAPQAPVANAGGPYSGTANAPIIFDGSASSDPKGESLSYSWSFGDGTTETGVTPTHTYAKQGSYVVTLTVTNADNLTSTATAAVTISAVASAPVAVADGPYAGTVNVALTFNGADSSDPQGQTLTYAWDFGDGTTAATANPAHTYTATGTFNVSLTVTNTSGLYGKASTTAVISARASQPPLANAGGPYRGNSGQPLTFNASASTDPKNEALTYAWNFGDGATATGSMPTHTYVSAGNYAVVLTVTNADGVSASANTTANIKTTVTLASPVIHPGGPYSGVTGVSISFDGSTSYDPSSATMSAAGVSLSWDFGDGSAAVTGPQPIHVYVTPGTYTVTLTGTTQGGTASSTSTVTVTAGAPTTGAPTAVITGPSSGTLNTPTSFDGSKSSDPNALALTYLWVFGDGSSSTEASPSHSFVLPGTFNVTLTVSNGTTLGYASAQIKVAAPVSSATVQANAGGPYTAAINQVLHLDGTKTTNPSAHVLTYNWDFGDGTTGTGASTTHIYGGTGTYQVSLNVLDGTSSSSNATAVVNVTGPAAEAITANAGGPYSESTGKSIVLDGSGSTDNLNLPLTYMWDFGDGTSGTGITPAHTYTSPGTYTATLTASNGTISATATTKVSIAQSIDVTLTSPKANQLFGPNAIATVTGTVSTSGLNVNVNGIAAQVSGNSFTAAGVALREGVNLLVATATDGKGGVGTGSVSVNMDATPPVVSITAPAANAILSTTQTAVTGLINDIVTGTIGSNDVTVTVNGQPAQVTNRSYLLPALALVPGANTLKIVATDRVGNVGTTTETVTVLPPSAQLSLHVVSGDAQSAVVHTLLMQPLVVQLLSAAGAPVAGRPVTFTVSRGDGMVEAMPTIAQNVSVTTDATGSASVLFQLGSRSGLGVNQVTATTPGAAGAAVFSESSTVGTATQIHLVRGDSQRGLLGTALPEAFQAIVQDRYGNPISGANVTFTSQLGGGTLDNTTVVSDSNGKASATLTLGQQEGIGNYVVQADVAGDTGAPVVFRASGYAAGPISNTSVSGVVLDNSNTPVMNATVTLANTGLSTTSDANGRFSISGAPVGTVTLTVDGSTATSAHTFPFLSFVLIDLPGQNNSLTKPIYLPFIDVDNAQTVGGNDPVTLTIAGAPGVAFTIAPNSVTFPDGSRVGKLSLSQVKSDMVPMIPSNGTAPNLVWTLQPAGTRFSQPVQVTLPNTQGLPPGTVSEFYQYDHDLEQFVSAGTMHVSADGSVMVSDAGFGITKAGWGHGPVVPDPTTCIVSTQSTTCSTVYAGNCGTSVIYNDGAACGNEPTDQCHQRGTCKSGACIARWKPDGAPCTGQLFCSDYECKSAACVGTPRQDQDVPNDPSAIAPALQIESAFTAFGEKVKKFFGDYGGGVEIAPYFSAPTQSEKSTCCEAKKQNGLLVETLSVGGGINVQSPDFTVIVGGVPLGIVFPPPVGTEGLTLQVKGGVGVNAVYESNQCTDHKCWGGGPVVSIGVEGKLRFGVTAFNVYGTIGGSITGTAIINCDRVTSSLTWSGVELKGGVQVGPVAFPYPAATYIGPATIFMRYDLNTGQINYGVQ